MRIGMPFCKPRAPFAAGEERLLVHASARLMLSKKVLPTLAATLHSSAWNFRAGHTRAHPWGMFPAEAGESGLSLSGSRTLAPQFLAGPMPKSSSRFKMDACWTSCYIFGEGPSNWKLARNKETMERGNTRRTSAEKTAASKQRKKANQRERERERESGRGNKQATK